MQNKGITLKAVLLREQTPSVHVGEVCDHYFLLCLLIFSVGHI